MQPRRGGRWRFFLLRRGRNICFDFALSLVEECLTIVDGAAAFRFLGCFAMEQVGSVDLFVARFLEGPEFNQIPVL